VEIVSHPCADQENVRFTGWAAIVDEQHRFGVMHGGAEEAGLTRHAADDRNADSAHLH